MNPLQLRKIELEKGCLTVLELFSGTKSFTKEAEKLGHKCFTIDFNKKFNPDLCIDIMDLDIQMLPLEFQTPDIVWASPPCTEYSHAKRRGERKITYANKIVNKTLWLIQKLNPKVWIIENPQTGLLKNQDFMKDLPYTDTSYCKYGYSYRKQTRFWNNAHLVLETCNKDCNSMNGRKHNGSAGNGRKKYSDKSYKLEEKYSIPPKLCQSILKQIEITLRYCPTCKAELKGINLGLKVLEDYSQHNTENQQTEMDFSRKSIHVGRKYEDSVSTDLTQRPAPQLTKTAGSEYADIYNQAKSDILKKVVVWADCSLDMHEDSSLSFEKQLKLESSVGEIWLVDEDCIKDLWGDDWDDAPASCNAGRPYEDKCKGLVRMKVCLGKPLEQIKSIGEEQ